MTALHWAADGGHVGAVEVLIGHRKTDIDALSKAQTSPLHKACWNGHAAVAQVLVQAGAEVDHGDQRKHTPLHWAIHKGHLDVVHVLLNAGASSGGRFVGPSS
jgi:ankyrin repeat protein